MQTYDPRAGEAVSSTCEELVALVKANGGEHARAEFNGVWIHATADSTAEGLESTWREEMERRHQEHVNSPEYKRREQEAQEKAAAQKTALRGALSNAGLLELSDAETWAKCVKNNQDGYGGRCVRYAEEWGRLMQVRIENGETVAECAGELSHLADDDGITGFMYGAAVSMLAACWKHGEELRRWHNKETQDRH